MKTDWRSGIIGNILVMLLCLIPLLIGGALIETPLKSNDMQFLQVLFGIVCGAPFLILGGFMFVFAAKDLKETISKMTKDDVSEMKKEMTPGFKEANTKNPLGTVLTQFRKHYSDFFASPGVSAENEPVQKDVTQIYRNVMEFRKNRLNRLGLTCDMTVKRMAYQTADGITAEHYSDGKYDITDIREEIFAKTVYRKSGAAIWSKTDRDTANYTLIHAKQIGKDKVVCPNCGAEMTRSALLDGCDYCGTKFTVEDLGTRISDFTFRADYKLRYAKYQKMRNSTIVLMIIGVVIAVVAAFMTMGIKMAPEMMADGETGIILTILAMLFATAVSSAVYIFAFIVVYAGVILPILSLLGLTAAVTKKMVNKIEQAPQYDRTQEKKIRRTDPNFSLSGFYSGVQNKIASVIYADGEKQINAFAEKDLKKFLGHYDNVAGVDVDHMEISSYQTDKDLQRAEVLTALRLTEYNGRKCRVRKENLRVKLVKAVNAKTEVVCAPAVMKCSGCGSSLDLLQGKACASCGRELDLKQYDWVIEDMKKIRRIS